MPAPWFSDIAVTSAKPLLTYIENNKTMEPEFVAHGPQLVLPSVHKQPVCPFDLKVLFPVTKFPQPRVTIYLYSSDVRVDFSCIRLASHSLELNFAHERAQGLK